MQHGREEITLPLSVVQGIYARGPWFSASRAAFLRKAMPSSHNEGESNSMTTLDNRIPIEFVKNIAFLPVK
jgi:hypothetical protein